MRISHGSDSSASITELMGPRAAMKVAQCGWEFVENTDTGALCYLFFNYGGGPCRFGPPAGENAFSRHAVSQYTWIGDLAGARLAWK